MNSDLQVHLEGLYKIHLANTEWEHGVRRTKNPGPSAGPIPVFPYAPTHFIYAFFVFNTLYSIDWKTTTSKGSVVEWSSNTGKLNEDGKRREPRQDEQIRRALDYCLSEPAGVASFCKRLREVLRAPAPISTRLASIKPDKRIDKATVSSVRRTLTEIVDEGHNVDLAAIKGLFKYLYFVRCNLFHGLKTTIELKDEPQRDRLWIYARILETANRLLLDEAARRKLWEPIEDDQYIGIR